jgi:transcriptional regulator with XRE-family HTH domain
MKPEPIYQQIGGIIRALRRRADKAQDVLASQLGISRATLANMETGRQRILVHQLYAIAQALNVSLSDLLPPPQNAADAAHWSSLSFEGDLNPEQKKQVANLIGPIEAPARRLTEENDVKAAPTNRITRSKRAKAAR